MGKVIKKIVLTGGPCAGKSSSLDLIRDYLVENGYIVYVVQESATELINSGIKPFGENGLNLIEFQDIVLNYQLYKENLVLNIAKNNDEDKDIVIIYDRGLLDNKAYIGQKEFDKLINRYDIKEVDLINRYDLVIHLETAAKSEFYTTENNKARSEDKEKAIEMDKKTYDAWKYHRNLVRVKCYEKFLDKQNRIIDITDNALFNNVRKQNKYLISLDDVNVDDEVFYIKQFYLDKNDLEHRLREVKYKDSISYYYTIQEKLDNGESILLKDEIISLEDFNKLYNSNNVIREINKIRKYITINDKQFNIDIFDDGKVILEGNSELDENVFRVVSNVTGNSEYYNKNIYIDS